MEDANPPVTSAQHKRSNNVSTNPRFSWWDVQDENAKLPVRDMTLGELEALYNNNGNNKKSSNGASNNPGDSTAAGAAKSALKGLTKAINNATNVSNSNENHHSNANNPFAQVPVRVVVLKLLDLARIGDACTHRSNDRSNDNLPRRNNYKAAPTPQSNHHHHPSRTASAANTTAQPKSSVAASSGARRVQEANLMDFGNSPTPPSARKTPAKNYPQKTPQKQQPQLSRAEKLKREYAQNAAKQNRVWDDVDQRWVVQPSGGTSQNKSNSGRSASSSASSRVSNATSTNQNSSNTVNIGISLESSAVNVSGKSATVQAAVHARVNDMKKAQNAALQELRERERKAKAEEDAEDVVRRRLEPRIKAWSEEHGKKKQLRALLASLHIILWPEAKWKQVSIGDILDDKKARRCYLKATLKVHPDKTKDLDPEKRFIAKRVFDALSQAFTQFEGKHVG